MRRGRNRSSAEDPGGFRDLFEDMWSNLEDYEDFKKVEQALFGLG